MILLRKAIKTDFAVLKNMYMTEVEPHSERAEAFAHDLLSQMETILCFDDDILCGTVSWAIRGGLNDGIIEIIGLGVNAEYQRRGIATRLVNQVLSDAKNKFASKDYALRRIFLFMEEGNMVARQFYQKLGFVETATITDFYPSDGASIFVKRV
ncbi:MAG: GNAT family N-acetyltransferase [Candidatus Thorarchaeota archaeon]